MVKRSSRDAEKGALEPSLTRLVGPGCRASELVSGPENVESWEPVQPTPPRIEPFALNRSWDDSASEGAISLPILHLHTGQTCELDTARKSRHRVWEREAGRGYVATPLRHSKRRRGMLSHLPDITHVFDT